MAAGGDREVGENGAAGVKGGQPRPLLRTIATSGTPDSS